MPRSSSNFQRIKLVKKPASWRRHIESGKNNTNENKLNWAGKRKGRGQKKAIKTWPVNTRSRYESGPNAQINNLHVNVAQATKTFRISTFERGTQCPARERAADVVLLVKYLSVRTRNLVCSCSVKTTGAQGPTSEPNAPVGRWTPTSSRSGMSQKAPEAQWDVSDFGMGGAVQEFIPCVRLAGHVRLRRYVKKKPTLQTWAPSKPPPGKTVTQWKRRGTGRSRHRRRRDSFGVAHICERTSQSTMRQR